MTARLLRASAGTGKTYRLVEAYVEAVLQAKHRPSEIVAITFTRKAALELKTRIRARLRDASAPEELLAELSRPPINNFHGLALQLLSSVGALPEGVTVLGEQGDDRLLFIEACEEAWFGDGTQTGEDVKAVAGFVAVDTTLPEALWDALARAREDGLAIDGAALIGRYDVAAIVREYAARAQELAQRLLAARPELSDKAQERVDRFVALIPKGELAPELWAEAWQRAAKEINRQGKLGKILSEEDAELLKVELYERVLAEVRCTTVAPHLARLIDAAWLRYGELKRERRALDFGDLIERTVALLSQSAELHAAVRRRVKTVLVDEAQDTNGPQLTFVRLLVGLEGPARDAMPPAQLVVVGDVKQAIYTFRGANPEGFARFADDVQALGGEAETLTTSYRSTPALVAAINHLGTRLFLEGYDPLVARAHDTVAAEPAVEWVAASDVPVSGAAAVLAEAMATASFVQARVAAGAAPRDFAVLLASMSNAPLYGSALANAGVPVVMGGGGGLYDQSEIVDVIHLISWLCDSRDKLAAAVTLRSPIVGVSENGLLSMFAESQRLHRLRDGALDEKALGQDSDRQALRSFAKVLPKLVRAARLMSPHALLRYADTCLDLTTTYLAMPGGEQRVANLERLFGIALAFERAGQGGAARFAREQVRRWLSGHKEPVSPIAPGVAGAVTITTVHQSKGLEYPVVLLADLAHGSHGDDGPVRYRRGVGLVFRPNERGFTRRGVRWMASEVASRAEAEAELKRLLYVAVTRAQRQVVLMAAPRPRPPQRSFLRLLDPWRDEAQSMGLLREASAPERLSPPQEALASATPDDVAWAQQALATAEPPPVPAATRFVLPVTELETYVQCLRRGALLHQLGYLEDNIASRTRQRAAVAAGDGIDPLARGRLAHGVLAALERRAEFTDVRAFIAAEMGGLGYDPADPRLADVIADVEAFLESPLGRELVTLGPTARRHELPFQYVVDAAPYSAMVHGQMDLLYFDPEGPVVVDFKHAKSSGPGLSAYATQLDAYAQAVAMVCGISGPIRTRLVFLKDHGRAPLTRVVTPGMREAFVSGIGDVVRSLAQSQAAQALWPGQLVRRCRALDCGFVERCHPAADEKKGQLALFGS